MSNVKHSLNATIGQSAAGWTYRFPVEMNALSLENIDHFWWHTILNQNWIWALYAGLIYLVTIFGIKRLMKKQCAMDLKIPLFLWNLSVGIFSFMGFARTAPGLWKRLWEPCGFYNAICIKTGMDIPTEFWAIMFVLSKPVELCDTVFTVLRKRPLAFLQWYHHLVTMLACWTLGPLEEPVMICYMVLNYGVHSFLYTYFALRTIGLSIPKIFGHVITTAEFAQMIVGLVINTVSMYYKEIGEDCARTDTSIIVFSVIYGSFFLLFGKLFYDLVIASNSEWPT